MAHHVSESNPTHHIQECGETVEIEHRWYHMCERPSGHEMPHRCGERGTRWLS